MVSGSIRRLLKSGSIRQISSTFCNDLPCSLINRSFNSSNCVDSPFSWDSLMKDSCIEFLSLRRTSISSRSCRIRLYCELFLRSSSSVTVKVSKPLRSFDEFDWLRALGTNFLNGDSSLNTSAIRVGGPNVTAPSTRLLAKFNPCWLNSNCCCCHPRVTI